MLTNVEKHAVESMLDKKFTDDEIFKAFPAEKRKSVVSYMKKVRANVKPEKPQYNYDRNALLAKLSKAGIHGQDAERLIAKALPNVSSKPEVNELYNEVIRNIGPLELMVRTTEGGNKTVAIMTAAASEKGQERAKKKQEDYVFKPQDGQS